MNSIIGMHVFEKSMLLPVSRGSGNSIDNSDSFDYDRAKLVKTDTCPLNSLFFPLCVSSLVPHPMEVGSGSISCMHILRDFFAGIFL